MIIHITVFVNSLTNLILLIILMRHVKEHS